MSETQYRIVFRGELVYGFDQAEVRSNLQRLCKYDDATLDRLFAGKPFVLKGRLTQEAAKRYLDALKKAGVVCVVEAGSEVPRPQPAKPPAGILCPKCKQSQPAGTTCLHCGIVFIKYQQMQERQKAAEKGELLEAQQSDSALPGDAGVAVRLGAYFALHQEQAFILKAFLMIAVLLFVKEYLSGFLFLLILLFPVLFLLYVRLEAGSTGQSPTEVLAQHITFMPVMYAEGERKREGAAWVTYSLIFINVLVFYGFELRVNPELIFDNLIFLPYAPNLFNVPLSLFTSIFLHAGGGHLWGNMLFLWAVGTVVEKRIGWRRFLVFYLLAGVAACLLTVLVEFLFFRTAAHLLGASGAIAGVMGLFAVRCYFKSMVFPLPILGIFSLILPISLKVRLNSLVIIGLFFLADLSGGISQVTGASHSNIGHWAHIGGMLCGIALGMLFKLGDQAVEERHLEIGSQALSSRGDLYQGEESLRLALQKNPDNTEAMILLARLLSKFQSTTEAEDLYRKAMELQINSRPNEVAVMFKEYYNRYLRGVEAVTQFRLAAHYHQHNDYDWAARCLELLSDDETTPPDIREKAIFQCARQMEFIGKFDIARQYYQLLVATFPTSAFAPKAEARLAEG